MVTGSVPLDPEREEELPARQVPQLASRAQRLSDDVHGPQDRKARQVHERPRGKIPGSFTIDDAHIIIVCF